ncbi:YitT family protein [Paenibacillus sp. DMB20]|uniref:YitT family protein n=1 Tax=Paenibacillus sp. DMB20 TaxID=1642570 RepID=UPI0006277D56|nr:YitT family protein [Paenibacillus sp. DMB20]KKO54916.1 membrane protein [Paenibacillus sp. DMB20]
MTKRIIRDALLLILGSLLFAIGINYFSIPNRLSEGGIIGITVVTYYLFEWSPGLVNFILNGILMVIGYRYFDKKTTLYTLISIVLTSAFLRLTEMLEVEPHPDTLLAALFAGVFVGIGLGLIFRSGGTSGGSAILARLANAYWGWSLGKGILIIDIIVILGSVFIIGQEKAMYTLIAVYVGAKIIDVIVEGMNERVAVLIISNHPGEVLERITTVMSRGLTVLEGRGGYTGSSKELLYIVISKQEVVQLKNMINDIDENAYVTIHNVHELIGTGYKAGQRLR